MAVFKSNLLATLRNLCTLSCRVWLSLYTLLLCCLQLALEISKLKEFTGFEKPTVIT